MRLPQSPLQGLLLGAAMGAIIGLPIAYVAWRAEQHDRQSRHCRLMVSPTFTHKQQQQIKYAAYKWEKATGNLVISVQVGACPVEDDVVDACLIPTDKIFHCGDVEKAVGCTAGAGWNGWKYSRVDIDVECGDLHTLSHITQHEIGHVLGLPDTDAKGVVMHRYVDCAEIQNAGSQDVSQSDVQEYRRIHVLLDNPTETR